MPHCFTRFVVMVLPLSVNVILPSTFISSACNTERAVLLYQTLFLNHQNVVWLLFHNIHTLQEQKIYFPHSYNILKLLLQHSNQSWVSSIPSVSNELLTLNTVVLYGIKSAPKVTIYRFTVYLLLHFFFR